MGVVINAGVSEVLKFIIRQPRPQASAKDGFGMPSNHSSFVFFFAVFFSLWLYAPSVSTATTTATSEGEGDSKRANSVRRRVYCASEALRAAACAVLFFMAVIVSFSR